MNPWFYEEKKMTENKFLLKTSLRSDIFLIYLISDHHLFFV